MEELFISILEKLLAMEFFKLSQADLMFAIIIYKNPINQTLI